jgi:hypothetical protein
MRQSPTPAPDPQARDVGERLGGDRDADHWAATFNVALPPVRKKLQSAINCLLRSRASDLLYFAQLGCREHQRMFANRQSSA